MAFKKITIVFLSDGARKIRQIKIPKLLILILLLFSISAMFILARGINDYRGIKTQIPRLVQLKKENEQQKLQLISLAQKIDYINNKLIELKKFDHKLKVMVNLENSEDDKQIFGIGGSDPSLLTPDYTIEKAHRKLVRLMHQSLDDLNTEISLQTQNTAELFKFLENQKSILAGTPSVWPVRGWVSSKFGYRVSPFTNEKEFHAGLDISTRMKAPIIAPADGIVSSTGQHSGYGKILYINHGNGLQTKYAHLSKFLVKKGQYVKRGQKIAMVGKSGRTTGPHLHYEVHLKSVPVNPLRYILN